MEPFQVGESKAPRAEPERPSDTFAAITDGIWRVALRRQPGVFHAIRATLTHGAKMTWCGQVGGGRTIANGQAVHGCIACRDAMKANEEERA